MKIERADRNLVSNADNSISWRKPLAFLKWIISVHDDMAGTFFLPSLKLHIDKENKILPLFAKLCFLLSLLCAFPHTDCPSSINYQTVTYST